MNARDADRAVSSAAHAPSRANATAPRAFLGLSHSPLIGLNPVAPEVGAALQAAIADARARVRAFDPELVVIAGPDHYHGFFNELMPPFCLGTQATAVGDWDTPAGALWDGLDTPPLVPLFMNAVAPPGIPRIGRCLALGQAIGRFLDALPRRTLLIGSGGLSHEPPVPTLDHPDPAVRERITVRSDPDPASFGARKQRVMAHGMALAAGDARHKPLNPAWDARWLDALESGRLTDLLALDEDAITREAGLSAHESKTWLIARAATGAATCEFRHYQAIPEYVAGFGVMFARSTA
jgi:2,3-dihydroxyphenylpropionate 1,2-dioxygenase